MTDMGDDYRAMRDHQRTRKQERERKFNQAWKSIRIEASEMGWDAYRDDIDGCWVFENDESDEVVRWWPGSGKTDTGAMVPTWPALKQYLQARE